MTVPVSQALKDLIARRRRKYGAVSVGGLPETKPVSTWTRFRPVSSLAKKIRAKCEVVALPYPTYEKHRPELFGRHGKPIAKDDRGRIMALARETKAQTKALTANAVLLLETLLFRFWNHFTGLCIPSAAAIAKRSGMSERTVHRAKVQLRAAGLLHWVRRAMLKKGRMVQTSNRYVIGTDCQKGAESQGSFSLSTVLGRSEVDQPMLEAVRKAAQSLNLDLSLLDTYRLAKT